MAPWSHPHQQRWRQSLKFLAIFRLRAQLEDGQDGGKYDPSSFRHHVPLYRTINLQTWTHYLISIVMERETTSREAKSFADGAYLSMNLSPSLLRRIPPSPLQPSVIKHPAP